jgi:hypothetical protein
VRLARALLELGVGAGTTREILAHYDPDLVDQQLAWLPFRRARRPSRLIVAAIRDNYEKPRCLR